MSGRGTHTHVTSSILIQILKTVVFNIGLAIDKYYDAQHARVVKLESYKTGRRQNHMKNVKLILRQLVNQN